MKNKKWSNMNVMDFEKAQDRNNNYFAWTQWHEFKRNVLLMLEAHNRFELESRYNYAELALAVLEGIYSVKPETDELFRFTLDLSITLLHIKQRKARKLRSRK